MKKEKIVNYLIDFVNLAVGVTALIISIYYSYKWLHYIGTPIILSLSLAITYVAFINIVFEGGIGMIKKGFVIKKNAEKIQDTNKELYARALFMIRQRYIAGTFVLLLWVLITSYSMISTIAGQYEQLSYIETTKIETGRKDATHYSDQLESIEEEINLIEEETILYKEELATLVRRSSTIESIEDRAKYRTTTYWTEKRTDEIREKISANNEQIKTLIKEKKNIKKQDYSGFTVESGTVYNYFNRIIGIDPLLIQFILALFPSIFIDIISPVSLAIFLYRKREK